MIIFWIFLFTALVIMCFRSIRIAAIPAIASGIIGAWLIHDGMSNSGDFAFMIGMHYGFWTLIIGGLITFFTAVIVKAAASRSQQKPDTQKQNKAVEDNRTR